MSKDTRKIEYGYKVYARGLLPAVIVEGRLKKLDSGWWVPQEGAGPTALFETLEQAAEFACVGGQIYKVAYVRSSIQDLQWFPMPRRDAQLVHARCVQHGKGWMCVDGKPVSYVHPTARGKVLADAVYPLERVC